MINEQSQQVFRNYIDKYKNTIHFVFVCTHLQKVNESIQSRLHILEIPSPSEKGINKIMNNIIDTEKIIMDEESKKYLIAISNNSIRIMMNYLEKIYILGLPINIELCKKVCSNISYQDFDKYITFIRNNQLDEAVKIIYNIYDYGYSVIDILDSFFNYLYITTLLNEDEKYKIIPYLCKYITIFHSIHEHNIELALFTNNILTILK